MKKEQILYGVKIGEPQYMEEILSTNPQNFERVKQLASNDGYNRFRIAIIDLSTPPNFTTCIH